MKTIPIQLEATYQKPGRSTTFCVKVVSKSGNVYGFTNLDDVVRFDDGEHYVEYDPTQSLVPQNIQQTSNMDPDNTELHGWFNNTLKDLIAAGEFNSAEITIYRVAYLKLAAGAEVVAYGLVGTVEYSSAHSGNRKVEYRGLDELITVAQTTLYSLTCRNEFGDDLCRMPFVWEAGVVTAVDDARMVFTISGVARPDGWFVLGVVEFLDGENATATMEVETWEADGTIKLSFPIQQNINIGDNVRIRQDCDKTWTNCKAYNNVVNMNAEHLAPVQDTSLMVPGAYIKSNNAI